MRKSRNIIWVITLLMFVSTQNNFAQDTGALTDEIKKEQSKLDQDKGQLTDKAKDKMKQDKDKMKQEKEKMKEKRDATKDEMKEIKAAKKEDMKEAKSDAKAFTDLKEDKMKLLMEKLEKASTEKEKQEIMKMIEAEKKGMKGDDGSSDAATSKGKPVTNSDATTATGSSDANDYDEKEGKGEVLKGKEFGIAKANDARAKVEKKEKDLANKELLVRNGRARIAAAKERLATAIAEGKLTEDQIARKQQAIDRAEAGIDKLEASINSGKEVYAKKKATLSDMYQDQD